MNKLLIISLLLQSLNIFGQNAPKLHIETPNQNKVFKLDTVMSGARVRYQIKIKNIGNAPLIIKDIQNTGCSIGECERKPILPNDTAIAFWNFDTHGRVGNVCKVMTVITNEPQPIQVWVFNVHILPVPEKVQIVENQAILKIMDDTLNHEFDLGNIIQGEKKIYTIRFKNIGNAPLIIKNIMANNLAPTWTTTPIMPNESGVIVL